MIKRLQTLCPKPEIDIDKKIADALSKVQKNFEEPLKKRDAAAKKEAERLAKLRTGKKLKSKTV